MKMPGFILGERQSTPFCSTLLERRSCWRFPCCRDAATLPCQVNRCRRPDRIRAQISRRQSAQSGIQGSRILRRIRNIGLSLGTLAQGLDLDHLCSFPDRDLPMPASPESSTTWPSLFFALDQRRSSNSDSSSRPTRAVRPVACSASKRLSTEIARSAAQARAGPAMPLRSLSPRSSSSKRLPRSFRVPSAMTTLFGSAIPCRRPGQGLLGASLGKHAIAGAVRRQSERDQPLFSGQSTTHRGTGNAPFPAQLGPSSAWR
jgi:hypothetical protein